MMVRVCMLALLVASGAGGQIRQVAAGDITMVVKGDGSVVGWGRETFGMAGYPPSPNETIGAPKPLAMPGPVQRMAVGRSAVYALLEDGTVWTWGWNDVGQLGDGGAVKRGWATPARLAALADIVDVQAGFYHGLALGRDGTVYTWGPAAPAPVAGLPKIVKIAVGPQHNLALTSEGLVYAWGSNRDGELGNGAVTTGPTLTPALVVGLDRVVAIAAGGAARGSSGAIRADGTVWMWGSHAEGMMGNGIPTSGPGGPGAHNPRPMPVKGIAGAKSLVLGGGHAAVLLGDGTLRMWGHDGWGQLGFGTSGFYHEAPVKTRIAGVAAVYLGGSRSYAVKQDGTLWVWGPGSPGGRGVLRVHQHVPVLLPLP